jgi:uncharacterized protein (TIGR02246 family)
MRKIVTLLIPLALIAMSSGCTAMLHRSPESAPAPAGAATAEDLDRLFAEHVNAGDLDGIVALYEPTATLVRQDRSAAIGTAAIREEFAKLMALRPQITMNVIRVLSAGDDVAVLYDDWHAVGTDQHGKPVTFSGHASEVARRQSDGTWRFAVDDPDARSVPCAARAHAEKHPHKAGKSHTGSQRKKSK